MVDSRPPRPAVGLRSSAWLGDQGTNGFIARHHLRGNGFGSGQLDGRPVVGIANTWSELVPCNAHLRGLAEAVKRGVLQAGGLPLEFPVMSLGEPLMRPTSMLFRNLMAMQVEETVRANPLDSVVMLTGCDKTTPAGLMALASVDLPSIVLTGGPMLNGKFRGRDVGSGTEIWRMTEDRRAGEATDADLLELEGSLNRSAGHCMTMGTASTMACLAEAMGMQLSGSAAWPAVDSRRMVLAEEVGRRAVQLPSEGLRPSQVMSEAALHNAVRVNAALGGSTNAILHLLAIAGRLGITLKLADFEELARDVPLLVDLLPSGRFLMEEFAYAGGVPALLMEMRELLDMDTLTVSGRTLGEEVSEAKCYDSEVIRPLSRPIQSAGSCTAVLWGNLCPDGAVIKQSAVAGGVVRHRGPALVFDSVEDYLAVCDDPDMAVTSETVLIVRNAGPRGYPGMPEVGNLPVPRRLLDAGVRDVVRISDARMSGTAYGTVVLHVAPEAAAGGPLSLVQNGDMIVLDVPKRSLSMEVGQEELDRRRQERELQPAPPLAERGWLWLYREHVLQADRGVDLDFLVGSSGAAVPRPAF